jgi:hypothetical protein
MDDQDAYLAQLIEQYGLQRANDADPAGVKRAFEAATGYVRRRQRPDSIYAEPAHVYRFGSSEPGSDPAPGEGERDDE